MNKKYYELKADLIIKNNPNLTPAEMFALGWKQARELSKDLVTEIFTKNPETAAQAEILIGGIGESREYFEADGKLVRKDF
jgi:hypothetical protein